MQKFKFREEIIWSTETDVSSNLYIWKTLKFNIYKLTNVHNKENA